MIRGYKRNLIGNTPGFLILKHPSITKHPTYWIPVQIKCTFMSGPVFGRFRLKNAIKESNKVTKRKKPVSVRVNKGVKKRSRNGCLTCRKRKIKCSGFQKHCENCLKSSYICIWPSGNESLSHENNFVLEKCVYQNHGTEIGNNDLKNRTEIFESKEDELFRKVLVEINLSALDNISARERKSLLDTAFIKGFMTDVSPQLAHIKLQPGAAFIPLGKDNVILQHLFHSCGASFLYRKTKNEKMKLLSQSNFDKSVEVLTERVSKGQIFGGEIWMPAFFLLTYLKLKFVYEGQRIHTLSMLAAIEAIKFWVIQKQDLTANFELDPSCIETVKVLSANPPEATFVELINNLRLYTSNRLLCLDDDGKQILIAPSERTILESFVYNYANAIFRCERSLVSEMTSPFIIFDSLRPYLTAPMYQCAVPWMNHPIVGAAFPLMEHQAKLCWFGLSKEPISEEEKITILEIRNAADTFVRPSLPTGILSQAPQSIQNKLLESTYAAEILAKALYVYSTRLLYPDLPLEVELVQSSINEAYEAFHQISSQSQIHVMLLFSIAVIGCASVKTAHKDFILQKLEILKEVFKVYSLTTLEPLFKAAWTMDEYGISRGWDVLFDPKCIESVVL